MNNESALPVEKLSPAPKLNLQGQPIDFTNPSILQGVQSAIGGDFQTLDAQYNQLNTKANTSDLQYQQALRDAAGIPQQQASMEGDAGLAEKRKSVKSALDEVNRLATEAQIAPYAPLDTAQKEGRVITEGVARGESESLLRRNTIEALRANAVYQAKQGDLSLAQNEITRAIDLKYKEQELKQSLLKQQYESNKDVLDRVDKKRSEALGLIIKERDKQIADKKATDTAIEKMLVEAAPVAPSSILAKAREVQNRGGSATEVALALGQYGGDYYKTALLKEQIQTEKAQQSKIYSAMATEASTQNKAEADSWVTNIASGKAKLSDVPAKLKSLVSLGLSQSTISSPEVKSKIEASQSVYDLAQELLTAEGKGGAVGAGFGKALGAVIPGYDGTAFSGTDRATYEAKFSQLKDTLASSNLDKLKGAMSDKDIEFLRNIGTALKLEMPESAFDAELKKVQKVMTNVPGVKPKVVENKFSKSLGQSTQQILGTEIINKVGDDGSIDFKLP